MATHHSSKRLMSVCARDGDDRLVSSASPGAWGSPDADCVMASVRRNPKVAAPTLTAFHHGRGVPFRLLAERQATTATIEMASERKANGMGKMRRYCSMLGVSRVSTDEGVGSG
jgi:hypothetical protein